MLSESNLKSLNETMINFIDNEHAFAYSGFSNLQEQRELSILSNVSKVIIYDTRTGYFNASMLYDSFKDEPNKKFNTLLHSCIFRKSAEDVEKEINKYPNLNRDYKSCPNWDTEYKYFKATYTVNTANKYVCCRGVYAHPDLLIVILSSCNLKLMKKLSRLVMTTLLHESINETITLNTINENMNNCLHDSLEEYNNIVDVIKTNDETLIEQINTHRFNLISYLDKLKYVKNMTKNILDKPKRNKMKRKTNEKNLNSEHDVLNNQAILVIANYDDDKCKYGSKQYKLTLLLINECNIEYYVDIYNNEIIHTLTEDEIDELLYNGKLTVKTDVLLKIVSLQNVPDTFVQDYLIEYEDNVEIWIEKNETSTYLITTDIDKFKETFIEYIGTYMKY